MCESSTYETLKFKSDIIRYFLSYIITDASLSKFVTSCRNKYSYLHYQILQNTIVNQKKIHLL